MKKYKNTRDKAGELYKLLVILGITTLPVLIPAITGGAGEELFLYFIFIFPLVLAFQNWIEYSMGEKNLWN